MGDVVSKGVEVTKLITAKITWPYVYAANKIAEAASTLPGLFGQKGAFLGQAVAVPVQLAASAGSELAKGVTGFIVGVPVGIGTGVAAGAAGAQEALKNTDLVGGLKSGLLPVGNLLLKPVLLVAGANSMLIGKVVKIAGSATDLTGGIIQGTGQALTLSGQKLKGMGIDLLGKGLASKNFGSALDSGLPEEVPFGDLLTLIPQPLLNAVIGMSLNLRGFNDILGSSAAGNFDSGTYAAAYGPGNFTFNLDDLHQPGHQANVTLASQPVGAVNATLV